MGSGTGMANQPPMHTCMQLFPAKRTHVSMSRLHTKATCGHLYRDSRESQCRGWPGHQSRRAPVCLIHTDLVVLVRAAVCVQSDSFHCPRDHFVFAAWGRWLRERLVLLPRALAAFSRASRFSRRSKPRSARHLFARRRSRHSDKVCQAENAHLCHLLLSPSCVVSSVSPPTTLLQPPLCSKLVVTPRHVNNASAPKQLSVQITVGNRSISDHFGDTTAQVVAWSVLLSDHIVSL